MNKKSEASRVVLGAVVLAALLLTAPTLAQTEGYDLVRQITSQIVHPNVLIVQDVSGSMTWDLYGNSVGVNSVGSAPASSWSHSSCYLSKCKKWTYTLKISQALPSRMNTVKNALGNSVSIYSEWAPSATYVWPSIQWKSGTVTGPVVTISKTPLSYSYAWTVTYSSTQSDPGAPYSAIDVSDFISAGSGGALQAPADLVGKNSNVINWGLETFSGTSCGTYGMSVAINSDDNNQAATVAAIENRLALTSYGGLDAGGSTPTRAAVNSAIASLTNVYGGDPKKDCGRTYGAILVTDGLSNYCNPNNGNWISPCGACPGPSCCDGGSSGYNCPSNYTSFAAGASENLWNLTLGGKRLNVRTWVIGISNAVGPCELNFTAYMGRTDAAAVDAGFDTASDIYLPTATGDTSRYTINASHQNYAYFATSSSALSDAFASIIAGMGAGNYLTAGASVSTSSPSTSGDVMIFASVEYPAWKGHVYAYDMSKCDLPNSNCTLPNPTCDACTGTATNPVAAPPLKIWDAGQVLANSAVGTDHTNGRAIYTWTTGNNPSIVEIKGGTSATDPNMASTVSALNGICNNCGITASVVDFMRGNTGQINGTKRSWLLGGSLNSAPAIISGPKHWGQKILASHDGFEATYVSRHPMIWLGTDDGMLHAFDVVDGTEILALAPPELLPNQVSLYNNYVNSNGNLVTGEPTDPSKHIYGVASSPRFTDVNLGTANSPDYHTVLLLTEGPGHDYSSATNTNALSALDVTHPYPGRTNVAVPYGGTHSYAADPNYDPSTPFNLLWRVPYATGNLSWSVPAMAAYGNNSWIAAMGSGFNPASSAASSVAPSLTIINAQTGSVASSETLANPSGTPLVGNQAFAHTVFWQRGNTFNEDNLCTEVIQATEGGQLWMKPFSTSGSTGAATAGISLGANQPIYYSPAVSAWHDSSGTSYALYAFASGTYYERSSSITGANVGQTGGFQPTLYVYAMKLGVSGNIVSTKSWSFPTNSLARPAPATGTLGNGTQVTSSAYMFVPASGLPVAYFVLYDPQGGTCIGESYTVQITFDPTGLSATTNVRDVGEGTSTPPVSTGDQVYVIKSGVGNEEPKIKTTGDKFDAKLPQPKPSWWMELQ